MQYKYLSRNNPRCRRLILIFAGWAMDWRPFKGLAAEGYDVMVVWDYRELTFNWKSLLRYDEICLMAWSMGVFIASVTIHEILPRVTKLVAVNGTLNPIHDDMGIPETTFNGTIDGLTPTNLRKFYRRMCTSQAQFATFCEHKPQRKFEEVCRELTDIETHSIFHAEQIENWDLAIVGRYDTIFPADNQMYAWRGKVPMQQMEAGHLPDFKMLINRLFTNKELVKRRFTASYMADGADSDLHHKIAQEAYTALRRANNEKALEGNIIEIGVGSGALTRLYNPQRGVSTLRLWDIADIDPQRLQETAPDAIFEQCDAEVKIRRTAAESVAFILSTSTIQWFNSPASFLRECNRVLVPGGLLVLSTFAQSNFEEIAQVVGTGLQLPTRRAWISMLPPNFELVWQQTDLIRLEFDSPRQVLRHISDNGMNAVNYGRKPVVMARRLLENYPRNADGRYTLTYRPYYLVARKTED